LLSFARYVIIVNHSDSSEECERLNSARFHLPVVILVLVLSEHAPLMLLYFVSHVRWVPLGD